MTTQPTPEFEIDLMWPSSALPQRRRTVGHPTQKIPNCKKGTTTWHSFACIINVSYQALMTEVLNTFFSLFRQAALYFFFSSRVVPFFIRMCQQKRDFGRICQTQVKVHISAVGL